MTKTTHRSPQEIEGYYGWFYNSVSHSYTHMRTTKKATTAASAASKPTTFRTAKAKVISVSAGTSRNSHGVEQRIVECVYRDASDPQEAAFGALFLDAHGPIPNCGDIVLIRIKSDPDRGVFHDLLGDANEDILAGL